MTENDIRLLKENDGKIVRLYMTDGEVVTARVRFVSETEQDVIVDLVSSTTLERYEKTDVQPAFEYEFRDIARVESV